MATKTKSNVLDKESITQIPEVEIRVSPNWLRLIRWVQVNLPHGQLCVKIANGEPTDLVSEYTKKRVRFDKEETIPQTFNQNES